MAQVTLRDALAMPVVRHAGPVVLTAEDGLARPVRWVHATELADIARLLREGDLVLMTGIALPEDDDGLTGFVESLVDAGAAGLMIELGRRWRTELPDALVSACASAGLPLVALTREVRFAAIIQAVGERVVDEQVAELRDAERVHETFTGLGLAEAGPREVLAAVQRLSGAAVVLEDEQHRVLDYLPGPDDVSDLLTDWTRRSRGVESVERTSWDRDNGWLVTRLGARDRGWGRLVVQTPEPPGHTLVAVVERAAAALVMHRLDDRHRDSAVRRTHHELLTGMLADPADPDLRRRCALAGVPVERRRLVGVTARPATRSRDEVLATTVWALHEQGVPALVCEVDDAVRALLSFPGRTGDDEVTAAVDAVGARTAARHDLVVGAGRVVDDVARADQTLRESRQVVDAVRAPSRPGVHRLDDVHLRGLLALLGDDDRVGLFVSRELDTLKAHDARHGQGLVASLRALVRHPGSKSQAAASVHLSRPAFYARLSRIEQVIGGSLDDPDLRVSLHVALLADDLATERAGLRAADRG